MPANTSNNIIPFPTQFTTKDPDEIWDRIQDMKEFSVEESLEFIMPPLFDVLTAAGYQIDDPRKAHLLIALVRAIMASHFQLPNALNNFIEVHSEELDMILELTEDEDLEE